MVRRTRWCLWRQRASQPRAPAALTRPRASPGAFASMWLPASGTPSPLPVGDVVVFRMDDDLLVKRVAALGGQPEPDEGPVVILRASHRRPGTREAAVLPAAPQWIPRGQIYVLGDNPPVSDDSRSFGP